MRHAIIFLVVAGLAVGGVIAIKKAVVQPITSTATPSKTPAGTGSDERTAFDLEKTGRFNEAGKLWEALLNQTRNVMYAAFALDAYYKGGAYHDAIRMNAVLIDQDPAELPAHLYNQGCLYACAGDSDNAMAFLKAAVARGWRDPQRVEEDLKHDLKNLVNDPRFQAWRANLDKPKGDADRSKHA
ncbi:MAG: hypothetical protein HY340_03150 [Candidatus Kerfeldbacteria bacterium]|nr:hypothetical protein [Candidatus Kerfeldbacteria bacterium]